MPYKIIIKELTVLIGMSVLTALAVNAVSPKGIAFIGDWDTSKGVVSARPKDDPVSHDLEIGDIFAAKKIYDTGETVFVDARTEENYLEGHIAGAVLLPAYQFEEYIENVRKTIPPFTMIVTYCSGRECEDSHVLAQCFLDAGYTDVRVFVDGYHAWEEKGFPTENASLVD